MPKTDIIINELFFIFSFILLIAFYSLEYINFEMCLFLILFAGFNFIGWQIHDKKDKKND